MPLIEYRQPERFVAGTVGPPGARTFFLQAVDGTQVTTVSLEKQQVQALAERMDDLIDGLPAHLDTPPAQADNAPLSAPIEDEFRVAALSLAWSQDQSKVVIECADADTAQAALDADPDSIGVVEVSAQESTMLKVWLSVPAAREFVRRALAMIEQGRPPCPFCGGPLEPTGHICPRANGYKR